MFQYINVLLCINLILVLCYALVPETFFSNHTCVKTAPVCNTQKYQDPEPILELDPDLSPHYPDVRIRGSEL